MLMVYVLAQVAHSDSSADVHVLREAHKAYQIVRTDFTENMKHVIFQFWTRYFKPLDPNPERFLQ